MTNFKHAGRMSRRQVAERLTDVAYALVVRSPAARPAIGTLAAGDGLDVRRGHRRPAVRPALGARWESAEAATRSAGGK